MSDMTLHITAFRDMDGEFQRMLEIKKFCDANHVGYPKEVTEYFWKNVDASDSEEDLREALGEIEVGDDKLRIWSDEDRYGCDIDLTDIPKEAKTIRFYVSL